MPESDMILAQFEPLLAALFKLVVLAMLIERALYFVFDWSMWRGNLEGKGIRAPVALGLSLLICWWHDFDVVAVLLEESGGSTSIGIVITAAIVASGSAAAMRLFQDVLGWGRKAQELSQTLRVATIEAKVRKLQADPPADPDN